MKNLLTISQKYIFTEHALADEAVKQRLAEELRNYLVTSQVQEDVDTLNSVLECYLFLEMLRIYAEHLKIDIKVIDEQVSNKAIAIARANDEMRGNYHPLLKNIDLAKINGYHRRIKLDEPQITLAKLHAILQVNLQVNALFLAYKASHDLGISAETRNTVVQKASQNQYTCLPNLVREYQIEEAAYLLAQGAEPKQVNNKGSTGLIQIANILYQQPPKKSNQEKSYEDKLAEQLMELAKVFILKGADINQEDSNNTTALNIALSLALRGQPEFLQLLLDNGVDLLKAGGAPHTTAMTHAKSEYSYKEKSQELLKQLREYLRIDCQKRIDNFKAKHQENAQLVKAGEVLEHWFAFIQAMQVDDELLVAVYRMIRVFEVDRAHMSEAEIEQHLSAVAEFCEYVQPWWKKYSKALACIVIAVLVAITGATVGAAIGIFAGIWTGPAAVIAALLSLYLGAINGWASGLALGASLAGLIAGGFAAYGFFKETTPGNISQDPKAIVGKTIGMMRDHTLTRCESMLQDFQRKQVKESPAFNAATDAIACIQQLKKQTLDNELLNAVYDLVKTITSDDPKVTQDVKQQAIMRFSHLVQPGWQTLAKTLGCLIIASMVAVTGAVAGAALMGFINIWQGPFAVLSSLIGLYAGLQMGWMAAVAMTPPAAGIMAGALAAYGFFKPSLEQKFAQYGKVIVKASECSTLSSPVVVAKVS